MTATDYNPHMLRKAEKRARDADAAVDLRRADVQALPFETDQFANAVAGLVFCSVDDPERGLRELPCKHRYHERCILEWLKHDTRCCLCRFDLLDD